MFENPTLPILVQTWSDHGTGNDWSWNRPSRTLVSLLSQLEMKYIWFVIFFYELKMEWIVNFQFCPCSLGGIYNCSTWITVVNFLTVPETDRNHELWNYERIWKLPIALLPREPFSLGGGKWGGLGLFSLMHHLLVQVTRNHTENMMLNGIEVNVPGL